MKYISIGAILNEGTEHILDVAHGGAQFRLTGEKARLWLNGWLGFNEVFNPMHLTMVEQLFKMGLVIKCDGSRAEEYRALTKCTIVPAEREHPYWFLRPQEKTVLQWLRNAGLVLSMAELVYLIDRNVPMDEKLIGSVNAQALVERIYTRDTVYNNILENQMERADAKDHVVKAVLELLRKKRISAHLTVTLIWRCSWTICDALACICSMPTSIWDIWLEHRTHIFLCWSVIWFPLNVPWHFGLVWSCWNGLTSSWFAVPH